jgi:hypothetical protein
MLATGLSGTTNAGAIVGLAIIGVSVVVIAALTAALFRAQVRLARAETELTFLRAAASPISPPAKSATSATDDADTGGRVSRRQNS